MGGKCFERYKIKFGMHFEQIPKSAWNLHVRCSLLASISCWFYSWRVQNVIFKCFWRIIGRVRWIRLIAVTFNHSTSTTSEKIIIEAYQIECIHLIRFECEKLCSANSSKTRRNKNKLGSSECLGKIGINNFCQSFETSHSIFYYYHQLDICVCPSNKKI